MGIWISILSKTNFICDTYKSCSLTFSESFLVPQNFDGWAFYINPQGGKTLSLVLKFHMNDEDFNTVK